MKTLATFLKMTLVGGLLVVLPLWVSLLLLLKAIKSALLVLQPIAKLVPQNSYTTTSWPCACWS